MLTEYIEEALERARYELIDDPDTPCDGEVPDLPGVRASGETLEMCRRELKDVIEGWLLVSVKQSLPIPPLGPLEVQGCPHRQLRTDLRVVGASNDAVVNRREEEKSAVGRRT